MSKKKPVANTATITITVGQLLNAQPGLQALSRASGLRPHLAFEVALLINDVAPKLQAALQCRNPLFVKLGKRVGETDNYMIPADREKEFQEAWAPFERKEIVIHAKPLTSEILRSASGLTPGEMAGLLPFMEKSK